MSVSIGRTIRVTKCQLARGCPRFPPAEASAIFDQGSAMVRASGKLFNQSDEAPPDLCCAVGPEDLMSADGQCAGMPAPGVCDVNARPMAACRRTHLHLRCSRARSYRMRRGTRSRRGTRRRNCRTTWRRAACRHHLQARSSSRCLHVQKRTPDTDRSCRIAAAGKAGCKAEEKEIGLI